MSGGHHKGLEKFTTDQRFLLGYPVRQFNPWGQIRVWNFGLQCSRILDSPRFWRNTDISCWHEGYQQWSSVLLTVLSRKTCNPKRFPTHLTICFSASNRSTVMLFHTPNSYKAERLQVANSQITPASANPHRVLPCVPPRSPLLMRKHREKSFCLTYCQVPSTHSCEYTNRTGTINKVWTTGFVGKIIEVKSQSRKSE